jgi:hypothetical protein
VSGSCSKTEMARSEKRTAARDSETDTGSASADLSEILSCVRAALLARMTDSAPLLHSNDFLARKIWQDLEIPGMK